MNKESLKQKGLTPTRCAILYLRYCLQNLPYNAEALCEVADVAPLNGTQYKAVRKALEKRLSAFIKKLDKSLTKHTLPISESKAAMAPPANELNEI